MGLKKSCPPTPFKMKCINGQHGKTDNFTAHPCFVEHRAYGSVNFSFFREKEETAP